MTDYNDDIPFGTELDFSNIEKILSSLSTELPFKEKITLLCKEDFPTNLKAPEVESLFIVAVDCDNIELIDYLIYADKNEGKPSLNSEKLYTVLQDQFQTDQHLIAHYPASKYFEIVEYLLNIEEFRKNLPLEVFSQFVINSLVNVYSNENKLLDFFLHDPEFSKKIKYANCFVKICDLNNIKILEKLFDKEEIFTNLSHQSNVELCVKSAVDNNKMNLLFYLLHEQQPDITFYMKSMCYKLPEAKSILEDYVLHCGLKDKIEKIPQKETKSKKKI